MTAAVALVGTGVIGRGWLKVFVRAGHPTLVYDSDPAQSRRAVAWFEQDLEADRRDGLLDAAEAERRRSRVHLCGSLQEALAGVAYVQESVAERLEVKQAAFAAMDAAAPAEAIL